MKKNKKQNIFKRFINFVLRIVLVAVIGYVGYVLVLEPQFKEVTVVEKVVEKVNEASNPIDSVLKRPEFIRKQRIEAEVIYLEEERVKKETEIANIEAKLSTLREELVDIVE